MAETNNGFSTDKVQGDLSVGRNLNMGGKAVVQGNSTFKGDLKVEGWLRANNVKVANKGLFASLAALQAAYPAPNVGEFAYVGDTLPADIYRCNTKGVWTATGQQGGNESLDFERLDNIEDIANDVNAKVEELSQKIDETRSEIVSQIDNIQPIVINGDVTNAPDEEDITSNENLLQFKDRSSLSGKGYVILRKGKSFASQVVNANTIYEVRYDFDLGNSRVTIPDNCILKFVGGKLFNGTIVGQKTIINSTLYGIFSSLSLTGTFVNNVLFAEWFGAIQEASRQGDAIQYAINQCANVKIPLKLSGKYCLEKGITIGAYSSLEGIDDYAGTKLEFDSNIGVAVYLQGNRLNVKNLFITETNNGRTNTGVKLGDLSKGEHMMNGSLRNVSINGFNVGLDLENQWCNHLDGVRSRYNKIGIRCGITTPYIVNSVVEANSQIGVYCPKDMGYSKKSSGVKLVNSVIEGNCKGLVAESGEVSLINCYFEDNSESFLNSGAAVDSDGRDVNGGHILVGLNEGEDVECFEMFSSHVVGNSSGKTYNSRVEIDRCRRCSIIGGRQINHLIFGENCNVVQNTNGKLGTKGSQYTYNSVGRKLQSSTPSVNIHYSQLKEFVNTNLYRPHNCDYISFYGNKLTCNYTDKGLKLIRSGANAGLSVYVRKPLLVNGNDICIVIDYYKEQGQSCYNYAYLRSTNEDGTSTEIITNANNSYTYETKGGVRRIILSAKAADIPANAVNVYGELNASGGDYTKDNDEGCGLYLVNVQVYNRCDGLPLEMTTNEEQKYVEQIITKTHILGCEHFMGMPSSKPTSNILRNIYHLYYDTTLRNFIPMYNDYYTQRQISAIPTDAYPKGTQAYYGTLNRAIWNGDGANLWVDALGRSVDWQMKLYGTTANRPPASKLSENANNVGYCYFDTDLGKPIWWNGTGWVDANGTSV